MLACNKRGVSIVVGYVLLITIVIAIAGIVYSWLRWYVTPGEDISCPDGVSLVIKEYECVGDILNLTIKNKGRFSFDGFVVKANDRVGARVGVYVLGFGEGSEGVRLTPGEEVVLEYDISEDVTGGELGDLTFMEVQPFINENSRSVFCENIMSQVLEGC